MKIMKMRAKKRKRLCAAILTIVRANRLLFIQQFVSGSRSSNPIIPPFVIYFFNLFIFIPVAFIFGSNTKKSLNYFSSEKCMRIMEKGVDRCGLAFFSCSFTTLYACTRKTWPNRQIPSTIQWLNVSIFSESPLPTSRSLSIYLHRFIMVVFAVYARFEACIKIIKSWMNEWMNGNTVLIQIDIPNAEITMNKPNGKSIVYPTRPSRLCLQLHILFTIFHLMN